MFYPVPWERGGSQKCFAHVSFPFLKPHPLLTINDQSLKSNMAECAWVLYSHGLGTGLKSVCVSKHLPSPPPPTMPDRVIVRASPPPFTWWKCFAPPPFRMAICLPPLKHGNNFFRPPPFFCRGKINFPLVHTVL